MISAQYQELPAPELSAAAPDMQGEFVRRADNSIFICAIAVKLAVQSGGNAGKQVACGGPVMEVVVEQKAGHGRRQQENRPQRDDIPPPGLPATAADVQGEYPRRDGNSTLFVWGERRGDRIVAGTLLCRIRTVRGRL